LAIFFTQISSKANAAFKLSEKSGDIMEAVEKFVHILTRLLRGFNLSAKICYNHRLISIIQLKVLL